MMTKEPAQFLLAIDEIDALLHDALERDFLSDQLYNRIVTKIGAFDEAFIRLPMPEKNEAFFQWAKNRIDKICEIIVDAQAKSHKTPHEHLMHPTGDYFNEDNTILLSPHAKHKLKKILDDKFSV